MSRRLRLVFAGTPDFAASHLQALLDNSQHDIVAVYSQPDRPAGRGKKLKPSPVKALALEHNIPVHQPVNFKNPEAVEALAELNPDLLIVVAYGLLLPKSVLVTPRLGCINVHASLLPRWRGAAPIQRAIEAGDKETGVTIMQMDVGLDTGDMLLKASCPITEQDTGGSLHDKLITVGQPALITVVNQLAVGDFNAEQQDNSLSNYASKMDKADMIIDWQQTAEQLALKIRAFNPFPICYTNLNGERLKIWQAHVVDSTEAPPGCIVHSDKKSIVIACGSHSLALDNIQLPGGKALDVAAVMNSKAELFTIGTQLGEA
ncbi:MAG: methionyl-tRNA formyltransferase [Pseudohongiellaceae bacterium]|jgi:methionyl-tRNA formyltransferase